MIYSEICASLRSINAVYCELLELAEKKRVLLMGKHSVSDVEELTRQEAALQEKAAALDKQRAGFVKIAAMKLGKDPAKLTVSELARSVEGDAAREIAETAEELSATLFKLKNANDTNRMLIETRLSYTTFMLDTLTRVQAPGSVYGAGGNEQEYTEQVHRFLDSEV